MGCQTLEEIYNGNYQGLISQRDDLIKRLQEINSQIITLRVKAMRERIKILN